MNEPYEGFREDQAKAESDLREVLTRLQLLGYEIEDLHDLVDEWHSCW
jgi:hypothetical protein